MLPRAGLRALVPGAAHWYWGQRERGFVLFISYFAGILGAAFAWGTWPGAWLLFFSFLVHALSSFDVVRQRSFPGPATWAVVLGTCGGLGAGIYLPGLTLVTLVAWPGLREGAPDGFLVNCWAYHAREPERDELIWYRPTPWGSPRVGRVVAGRGQEVDWSGGELRIDSRPDQKTGPVTSTIGPRTLLYRVPEGHVLVRPEERGMPARTPADGLALVSQDQILGRAWARLYPVRERRLL